MTHVPQRHDPTRPRRERRAAAVPIALASLACFALLALCAPAHAQRLRPWTPPSPDSILAWSGEARTRFQSNRGDSVGGSNYRAYELVGYIGRQLLRSLGRENLAQAAAVENAMDSLGLDTEIEVDPELPYFALLVVRNPFRPAANAVGFLCWYKQQDLKVQGVELRGGWEPRARVWWTGKQEGPYEWGVLEASRDRKRLHLSLFQLSSNGAFWNVIQNQAEGLEFSGIGDAHWADVNGDSRPEFVVWAPSEADSLVIPCSGCGRMIEEHTFVQRPRGFALLDSRIVPSPLSTWTRFLRLLVNGDRAGAGRFLHDPKKLDSAIAEGWASRRAPGSWQVMSIEPGSSWPSWLVARFNSATGSRLYKVNFVSSGGRWQIRDWERRANPAPADSAARSGTTGAR